MMLIYILKFSACLAIFLAFYNLFLEKENMHQFKRYYLLGMLLISAIIPLITFTQYIEVQPIANDLRLAQLSSNDAIIVETENLIDYLPTILWSIYGIGVFLFGIKFGLNLTKMVNKIRNNPKQRSNSFINVLLKDIITPHTFFSYIFLNKHKYETHQIPQEVLLHEQTHAEQKHSIDVLFIELFQIIFWFNPLVHIIKNCIKLNHEFLADKAVINKGIEASSYQQILLAFSTNVKEPQLANAINYSLIKKRFTVMKTQTTKRGIWLRSLILLPFLAFMLYSFSDTKVVEKNIVSKISITNHTARSIDIEVFNNGTYKVNDIKATKETFKSVINQLHQDITPEIRNQIINVHVYNGKTVSDEEVWFIYNSVIDYGFHRIVTYNQEIIRGKGNTPFAIENTDNQEHSKDIIEQQKATKAQIKEYNKLAKYYNVKDEKMRIIKLTDFKHLKYLYDLMSAEQKKNAEPFPNFPPPPPPAKKEQHQMWILINGKGQLLFKDDVATLTSLEVQLKKTRKNTQFAVKVMNNAPKNMVQKVETLLKKYEMKIIRVEGKDIPPPPPAPNAPKVIEVEEVLPPPPPVPANASPEQKAKYKKVIAEYAKKYPESVTRYKSKSGKTIEEVEVPTSMLPPPPPPPPIPENATPEQRKKYEEAIKNYKLTVAKSKQNFARVREVNDAERAKLIKVKEQYVAQRKASQEAKLARVAEMKQRQEKLRQEKKEYLVKRETLSKEQKAQLKKVKLRKVKEQKVEIEKRQEQLKKEKLKHVEERKVKAEEKRKHAMAMKLKRQEENIARQKMNIPPPPPPKSPLDHVVEMAKKDAIFYFEGKEISTDEAIKKLKQNKKINIRTYNKDSKKPKVYLSTKPIVVETKEKN